MTSSAPVYRDNNTCHAPSNSMKSVTPSRRLNSFSRAVNSAGTSTGSKLPRKLCTAGRGWSLGNSNTAAAPANCSRP